jgi:hypothetical protein
VDDELFDSLSKRKWHLHSGYAYTHITRNDCVGMHRVIMGMEGSKQLIDHINRDKLDNRRSNLRLCTQSENNMNSPRRNKSGYRGVYFHKVSGLWRAEARFNGKRTSLGYYKTAAEAGQAYLDHMMKTHPDFASIA